MFCAETGESRKIQLEMRRIRGASRYLAGELLKNTITPYSFNWPMFIRVCTLGEYQNFTTEAEIYSKLGEGALFNLRRYIVSSTGNVDGDSLQSM